MLDYLCRQHTWISWPLAFIIKSGMAAKQRDNVETSSGKEANGPGAVSMRYDHLMALLPVV